MYTSVVAWVGPRLPGDGRAKFQAHRANLMNSPARCRGPLAMQPYIPADALTNATPMPFLWRRLTDSGGGWIIRSWIADPQQYGDCICGLHYERRGRYLYRELHVMGQVYQPKFWGSWLSHPFVKTPLGVWVWDIRNNNPTDDFQSTFAPSDQSLLTILHLLWLAMEPWIL